MKTFGIAFVLLASISKPESVQEKYFILIQFILYGLPFILWIVLLRVETNSQTLAQVIPVLGSIQNGFRRLSRRFSSVFESNNRRQAAEASVHREEEGEEVRDVPSVNLEHSREPAKSSEEMSDSSGPKQCIVVGVDHKPDREAVHVLDDGDGIASIAPREQAPADVP